MATRTNYPGVQGAVSLRDLPIWWRKRPLNAVRIKTILVNLRLSKDTTNAK